MKIMMLTAGEGTRLRPYTHKLPKPALPFLGVPLLTYPLTLVKDLGITDIVFNTYHLPELLKKTVRGLSKENGNIHFSDEVGQIRASAGG
ncbi:MAG TPA: sugar phosphate nucleotidyltransferase, partial [Pseudobdellovibrionaceae bacterium]|nr:sugar phosphate nucleotidyltransferase [Pseudobdellovibrionaceae bacterium]